MFLGDATTRGRALIDRSLYLPKEWTEGRERSAEPGGPADVRSATKISLARRMVGRALDAGVPAAWVTGDGVYGSDYTFRKAIEDGGLGYVLGVRADQAVWAGFRQARVRVLLAEVPEDAWRRLYCGDGSKGPRLYDWAVAPVNRPEPESYGRWLRIRRSLAEPSEMACFPCDGPPATTLRDLVQVAGVRWAIEECVGCCCGSCGTG